VAGAQICTQEEKIETRVFFEEIEESSSIEQLVEARQDRFRRIDGAPVGPKKGGRAKSIGALLGRKKAGSAARKTEIPQRRRETARA